MPRRVWISLAALSACHAAPPVVVHCHEGGPARDIPPEAFVLPPPRRPSLVSAGPVRVLEATYGRACGAPHGNFTRAAAATCDERGRCDLVVDNRHGDPTPNCPKDVSVEWRCGDDEVVYRATHEPVVNEGYTVVLGCDESRHSAERVLLRDDFEGRRLDPDRWQVDTRIPQGGASVRVTNGHVELVNRGHLSTARSFDPEALGGVRVTGEWTLRANNDFLQVITRSDGVPAGTWGETQHGVEVSALMEAGAHSPGVSIRGRGGAVVERATSAALAMSVGETYLFDVLDAPPHVRLTLTKKGDPYHTVTVTGESGYLPAVSRITFHNREIQAERHVAELDDIVVTAVPRRRHEDR